MAGGTETSNLDEGDSGQSATGNKTSTVNREVSRTQTLAAPATHKLAEEKDVEIDNVRTDITKDNEAFVTDDQVETYATKQSSTQEATAASTQVTA